MGRVTEPYTDIVVLLPGIMGSELAQRGRPVWAPGGGAALDAILTFGRSVQDLTLPEGVGDGAPGENDQGGGVVATGLFPDIHVIPGLWSANLGYGQMERRLADFFGLTRVRTDGPPGNYLPFPYDWRLSIRYNGRRLAQVVDDVVTRWRAQGGPYAEARVSFITHSTGGLIARWAIDREGAAAYTRRLVTLATPHRGSMMAVDRLVNGVEVGWWPLQVDLTPFVRSLPGLHHLLPEYACLEAASGLQTIGGVDLPNLDPAWVQDALALHRELDQSGAPGAYDLFPLVGSQQLTATTGRIVADGVELISSIEGEEEAGDATVPRLAATPSWLRPSDPIVHYATDKHGAIPSNAQVLDDLQAILSADDVPRPVPKLVAQAEPDVRVAEVAVAGEPLPVEVVIRQGPPVALEALLRYENRDVVDRRPLTDQGSALRAELLPTREGLYTVRVEPASTGSGLVSVVTSPLTIWGPGQGSRSRARGE